MRYRVVERATTYKTIYKIQQSIFGISWTDARIPFCGVDNDFKNELEAIQIAYAMSSRSKSKARVVWESKDKR